MKMQDTSHRAGDYSRPNLNWQCGQDNCCQLGPTVKGKCSNTDNPCVPERTIKAKKRIATILIFSILIGITTLFISCAAFLESVSPGPVSPSHAEVADCQRCHASIANDGITQWIKTAATRIIGMDSADQHDDKQCLGCHALGENAFLAHSTAAYNFTSNINNRDDSENTSPPSWTVSMASSIRNLNSNSSEEIRCSTCHQEHKGDTNPRANFDPQKCHTCHEVKFDDIKGHPEYTNFPYTEPTHINYDHSNHRGKYFFEDEYIERSPKECVDCHITDQTGEWMLLKNFEETCSSCHIEDVLGMERETAKGIAVFTVPGLDIETLTNANFNVGEWPFFASGELTPFMHALLPKSFKESSLMRSNTISLSNLRNANEEQLQTAALLAWEIKSLYYELLRGGTAVYDHRLNHALGIELDQSTINRLIAALPKDTLSKIQQEWFPSLMQELNSYRTGKIRFKIDPNQLTQTEEEVEQETDETEEGDTVDATQSDESISVNNDQAPPSNQIDLSMPDEQWAASGGWYRDENSIRYRPTGHADLFFKTWLDISAAQYGSFGDSLFKALSKEESVGNCTQCHSIQSNMIGRSDIEVGKPKYEINWFSFKPTDDVIDFNRFSHVTHINQDCLSCHELHAVPKVDRRKPAQGVAASGFEYMDTNSCTQCHQKDRASDNCLTCHNYHAEPNKKWVESIPEMPEKK